MMVRRFMFGDEVMFVKLCITMNVKGAARQAGRRWTRSTEQSAAYSDSVFLKGPELLTLRHSSHIPNSMREPTGENHFLREEQRIDDSSTPQ